MSKATNLTNSVRNLTRKITEAKKPNFKALVNSMFDSAVVPLRNVGVEALREGIKFYQGDKNVAILGFWHDRIDTDKENPNALESQIFQTLISTWNLQGNSDINQRGKTKTVTMETPEGNPITLTIDRSWGNGFASFYITVKIEGDSLASASSFDFLPNIVPGTIYVSSYGYDMTLVDYYQVVRRSNKTIYLREIKSKILSGGGYAGEKMPIKDDFKNDEIIRSVLSGDGDWIRIGQHKRASLWDGKPDYYNTMD